MFNVMSIVSVCTLSLSIVCELMCLCVCMIHAAGGGGARYQHFLNSRIEFCCGQIKEITHSYVLPEYKYFKSFS